VPRFIAVLRDQNADVDDMLIPRAGHPWFTLAEDNPARKRSMKSQMLRLRRYYLNFGSGLWLRIVKET
jgi:hypothetical protein